MCLAIPGRITEITATRALLPMGRVDFGGVTRQVCLAYVPEARVGEYVLVHVGFAISRLDEQEAQDRLELICRSGLLEAPPVQKAGGTQAEGGAEEAG